MNTAVIVVVATIAAIPFDRNENKHFIWLFRTYHAVIVYSVRNRACKRASIIVEMHMYAFSNTFIPSVLPPLHLHLNFTKCFVDVVVYSFSHIHSDTTLELYALNDFVIANFFSSLLLLLFWLYFRLQILLPINFNVVVCVVGKCHFKENGKINLQHTHAHTSLGPLYCWICALL